MNQNEFDVRAQASRVHVGDDTTRKHLVDALNRALAPFDGALAGDDSWGVVSVEFRTMDHAWRFVDAHGLRQSSVIETDSPAFDRPVTIMFSMVLFAWLNAVPAV